MASKSGGTIPTPTTTDLSPSDIAIRIATAMGWRRGRGFVPPCWNPAEDIHDAVDLLEKLPPCFEYCIKKFSESGKIYVFVKCTEKEILATAEDPSLARAIALAVMTALESAK